MVLIGDNMASFPYQYINTDGIATIQSTSVTVGTDTVDFTFNPDNGRNPFRGLLLVNLANAIPAGTTGTLPIRFTQAGQSQNVTVAGGANWTVTDAAAPGVYLIYYDRYTNTLQVI